MSVFSQVPVPKHSISNYRLRPVNTMSFNFGGLYPIFCRTVLPGDKWSMNLQSMLRTVPLISPVMHRNDIKVDSFFVPFRLLWKSSDKWFECDTTVSVPQVYVDSSSEYPDIFGPSGIYDYLNFGTPKYSDLTTADISLSAYHKNALPLRAYRMIYDFYYRNKALESDILNTIPDFYGDSDLTVYSGTKSLLGIQYRSWRRDLFTSALPVPQTGGDVLIPTDLEASNAFTLKSGSSVQTTSSSYIGVDVSESSKSHPLKLRDPDISTPGNLQYQSGIKNTATIRKLRYAEQIDKYEEAMARAGFGELPGYGHGKFKEWLRGIWGVKSSDARLDRPEYLGGYRGPIQISEVPQTSVSTESSAQGNLAGKGLSVGGQRLFRNRFYEEPGILMVIVSVVPKSAYCQGDPREWQYESGFDFPNPFFDHLGDQDVRYSEINCLAPYLYPDDLTFGYNVRNYEMKDFPDEIHGALRDSLAYWHEGRIFDWDDVPGLSRPFVKVYPEDVSRIFPSVEDSDKLIGQFYFDIKLRRNLSYYGLPRQDAV